MRPVRSFALAVAVLTGVSVLAACAPGTESSPAAAKMRTKNGALIPLCGSTNTIPSLNNLSSNSNLLSNDNLLSNQNNLNIPTNNNPSNSCIINNINNSNLINNLPTTTSTTTVAPNLTTPQLINTPPTTMAPPTTPVITVSTPTTPPTSSVVAVSTPTTTTAPKCVVTATQTMVRWCKPAANWRLFIEVKNRPAPSVFGSSAAGATTISYRATGVVSALAATVTFKDSTKATFVFKGLGVPTEIFPK